MLKKFVSCLTAAACLSGALYLFARQPSQPALHERPCAFCNAAIVNSQKFYEDDLVIALYTHKPVLPGHCLVIPKSHAERFEELSDEEVMRIGQVIKKVNEASRKIFDTSSYLLLQKNGAEVGQTVPHVHFHYIPRAAGDDSVLKFMIRMYLANVLGPISPDDMHDKVEKMKEAIK